MMRSCKNARGATPFVLFLAMAILMLAAGLAPAQVVPAASNADAQQKAVEASVTREQEWTKLVTDFYQAMDALPPGHFDLSKEKAVWDNADKLIQELITENERVLKLGTKVHDNFAKVALPAYTDAEKALNQKLKELDQAEMNAKSDRQRGDIAFWSNFVKESLNRTKLHAITARELDSQVEEELKIIEQDLQSWRLGLKVIEIVRLPLQQGAVLQDLHTKLKEVRKRRDQAKAAVKALLHKLEEPPSRHPNPPTTKVSWKADVPKSKLPEVPESIMLVGHAEAVFEQEQETLREESVSIPAPAAVPAVSLPPIQSFTKAKVYSPWEDVAWVSAGRQDGLTEGDTLEVRRNGRLLAVAIVEKLYPNSATVFARGTWLQAGDVVTLAAR